MKLHNSATRVHPWLHPRRKLQWIGFLASTYLRLVTPVVYFKETMFEKIHLLKDVVASPDYDGRSRGMQPQVMRCRRCIGKEYAVIALRKGKIIGSYFQYIVQELMTYRHVWVPYDCRESLESTVRKSHWLNESMSSTGFAAF